MKIIQTHPQSGSTEERRQQLLNIHNRCIAAIREAGCSKRKNGACSAAKEQ